MLVRNGVPVAINKNKHQNFRAPGGRVTAQIAPRNGGGFLI